MTQSNWTDEQTGAGRSTGSSEGAYAEGLIHDVKTAAGDAGSQAKQMATEKAEALQGAAASHLHLFADAVRSAGDELAQKDPGPVSDLVRQAAAGLEQFSGALGRKSSAEMIDRVRDFGRQNPVGFLAGSMLAGFALARFAGSAAPQTEDAGKPHGDEWSKEEWDADRQENPPMESIDTAREGEGGLRSGSWETDEAGDPSDPDARPRDASFEGNWRTDV